VMVRLVLGDDNLRRRHTLRQRLEESGDITVVGEASTHEAVALLARNRRARVVLTDVMLSGEHGIGCIRSLTGTDAVRPTAVMVLTHNVEEARAVEALDNGASAYLVRPVSTDELVTYVRAVARGEVFIATQVAGAVRDTLVERGRLLRGEAPAVTDRFTRAELSLIRQLSSGITSNAAIAARLGVSVHTIRTQLQSCLRKTELADRTQLALWGAHHGLNPVPPDSWESAEGLAVPHPRQPPG
jgi:DNA-binding NarL/FixJ family response regulator